MISNVIQILEIQQKSWEEIKKNNFDHEANFNYASGVIDGIALTLAMLETEREDWKMFYQVDYCFHPCGDLVLLKDDNNAFMVMNIETGEIEYNGTRQGCHNFIEKKSFQYY